MASRLFLAKDSARRPLDRQLGLGYHRQPLIPPTVPFDGSDPLVAFLAWGIMVLVRRYAPTRWDWLRKATPALAVLLAVFLRAAMAAAQGEPLTVQVGLRAFAAGAVAVWGHSQLREVVKAAEDSPSGKPPDPKA